MEPFNLFGPNNKILPHDIKQGVLGDCYLLAAMSSLAMINHGEHIRKAFVTKTDNAKNVYIIRWILAGKPRLVAVDDWVPAKDKMPSMSRLGEQNAVWPLLIEKSWAKIHGIRCH